MTGNKPSSESEENETSSNDSIQSSLKLVKNVLKIGVLVAQLIRML
jgi:hypothetical protein